MGFWTSQVTGKFKDFPGPGKFSDLPSRDKFNDIPSRLSRNRVSTRTTSALYFFSYPRILASTTTRSKLCFVRLHTQKKLWFGANILPAMRCHSLYLCTPFVPFCPPLPPFVPLCPPSVHFCPPLSSFLYPFALLCPPLCPPLSPIRSLILTGPWFLLVPGSCWSLIPAGPWFLQVPGS